MKACVHKQILKFFFLALVFFPWSVFSQEIVTSKSSYEGGYNISCYGASNGSINIVVVDGQPPFLYNWSNGSFAKNQTNLSAGTYTVVVTDVNGNTVSTSINLTEPKLLEVFLNPIIKEGGYNISSKGGYDGEIRTQVVGGVPPYTYVWNNSSTGDGIGELTIGTYSVVVTGMNGCTATASTTLTEPTELKILSITSPLHHGFNVSCYEGNDGQIDLAVTGGVLPYSYQWSTGEFSEDLLEKEPGTYWVIVRDDAETAVAGQILLTGPSQPKVQLTPSVFPNGKNISCYGCANGTISTIVTGGASPYQYSWNNGATTSNLSGLSADGYNVQITDANNCILESGINILGPDREDWTMMGNAGTNPATNFFGTTDNKDVVFRSNNTERLRIKSNGVVETLSSLKIANPSSEQYSSVYVDSAGILQVARPDPHGNQCREPAEGWFRDNCSQALLGNIFKYPFFGNVGIGTDTPTAKIHVMGAGKFSHAGTPENSVIIGHDGNDGSIEQIGNGGLLINKWSLKNIKLCTGTSGDVEIGGSTNLATLRGKVGIGTMSPTEKLEIVHSSDSGGTGGLRLNNFSANNRNSEIKFAQSNSNLWAMGCDLRHNNSQDFFIYDNVTNSGFGAARFYINNLGNIGIGNANPTTRLDVSGKGRFDSLQITSLSGNSGKIMTLDNSGNLQVSPLSISSLGQWNNHGSGIFYNSGKVFIGMSSCNQCTDFDLYVEGGIAAREIRVMVSNFPDFVFDDDYKLMDLKTLEKHIADFKHLPGIPSAQDVSDTNGIDLGAFQLLLLQKIEEQTLYIISLQNQIFELNTKMAKN